MRGMVLVMVQLVIALLLVGAILPAVLFAVPAARGETAGTALAGVLLVAIFVGLRVVWRARRRE